MSNQPENEIQQTLTPEEMRQFLLAQVESSRQEIEELNEEELEAVAGGGFSSFIRHVGQDVKKVGGVAANYYEGIANGITGGHA